MRKHKYSFISLQKLMETKLTLWSIFSLLAKTKQNKQNNKKQTKKHPSLPSVSNCFVLSSQAGSEELSAIVMWILTHSICWTLLPLTWSNLQFTSSVTPPNLPSQKLPLFCPQGANSALQEWSVIPPLREDTGSYTSFTHPRTPTIRNCFLLNMYMRNGGNHRNDPAREMELIFSAILDGGNQQHVGEEVSWKSSKYFLFQTH